MRLKTMGLIVSSLVALALVVSSCSTKTPDDTTTTTVTSTTSTAVTSNTTTTAVTTSTAPTTTPVTVPAPSEDEPEYGGILSIAYFQGLASMDPADSPNYSGYFENMVFETLTQYNFAKGGLGTKEYDLNKVTNGNFEAVQAGRVAESWQIINDTTIQFNIRKGLRYTFDPSNPASALAAGREVTAQDMLFVCNRAVANTSLPLPGRDFIESWTAPDKYTLVLKMKTPLYSLWNDTVNRISGPYPPEVVTKYGNLKDWKNWVSTGPFIMTDFVADSSATFKKNPAYWGTDELHPENKIPYIDGISWLWITDSAARTAAFRTRKIDMLNQVDQGTVASVKKTNPEVIEIYRTNTGNGRAFFNMNEKPFNDVRVRQALWMAVDFTGIVRDFYNGGGVPRGFPMDSNGSWFTPTDQLPTAYVDPVTGAVTNLQDLWTYQPAKAQALLKEAGYPSGLTFDMIINSQYTEQALILQSYWKAIGANATIVPKDANATAALRYSTGGIAAFKGCLFIQSGGSPDPSDMDQQAHTNSAWNTGGFSSAYYDATYNKLVARMDLGPVQKDLVDLSFYVMSQAIRLDFPLSAQSGLIQPWINQYLGTGGMTGPMPYGLCHAARLWIDPVVKTKYTR